MPGGSFRLRRHCCLPLGVLEPELSSHLACASFVTPLNTLLVRRVRRAFGRLGALREHGGQKTVHLFVLNESELPQHRHTDESPGHFLDRQILINDLQHSRVVTLVRVNCRIRVPIRRLFVSSIHWHLVVLGQRGAAKIESRVVANRPAVAQQPELALKGEEV